MPAHKWKSERDAALFTPPPDAYTKLLVELEANTALSAGQGVCYERTTGTATDADLARGYLVGLPDRDNYMAFAGVAEKAVESSTDTQWIDIYAPGSVCPIYTSGNTTINQGDFLGCNVSYDTVANGTFKATYRGFLGLGSARILQTTTGAGTCLAELMTGPQCGMFEWIPVEELGAGGAFSMTQYGVTTIETSPPTALAAHQTTTLADGTTPGLRKLIINRNAQATYDVVITVTNGIQMDGSTPLATMTMDGANDYALLEWCHQEWQLISYSGTVLA